METLKNEPWNFCETPEEKCTMNYCDENGCQNRKRVLVSEEIPDIIVQLQADKAELLEALENLTEYGSTGEDAVEMKREIESLIQKHKQ